MKAAGRYRVVFDHSHPHANSPTGAVGEHIVVAVAARGGRPLPAGAIVHHHNGRRADNSRGNLVVCDRAYHQLLHRRINAREQGRNPGEGTYRATEMARLHDGGMTYKLIGERFGVSRQRVQQLISATCR